MSKRWLQGLVIAAAGIVGCLVLIPLHAQNELSVQVLDPKPNQIVQGPRMTISVAFKSSDNVNVIRADVLLDGKVIFGGKFSTPMPIGSFQSPECNIAKENPAAGPHEVKVRVTDAQGRICDSNPVRIVYQPYSVGLPGFERIPPQVRITGPKDGETIERATKVRVEAVDESGLKLLEVYIDGKTRGMTNSSAYELTWDPIEEKFASGKYAITASAWDIFDNKGNSDPVIVFVKNSYLPLGGNNKPLEFDALPSIPPQDLFAPLLALPIFPAAHGNFPAAWGGASNMIIPEVLTVRSRGYDAPNAVVGVIAALPDPMQPKLDFATAAPLAWGLSGDSGTGTSRAQTLAPQEALIQPKSVGAIGITHPSESPALPAMNLPVGEGRVIALIPNLNASLPAGTKLSPSNVAVIDLTGIDTGSPGVSVVSSGTANGPSRPTAGASTASTSLAGAANPKRADTLSQPLVIAVVPESQRHAAAPAAKSGLPADMTGGPVKTASATATPGLKPGTTATTRLSTAPRTPDAVKSIAMPVIAKATPTRPEVIAARPVPTQSLPLIAAVRVPGTAAGSGDMSIARVPATVAVRKAPAAGAPANANPLVKIRGRAPRIMLDDAEVAMSPKAYVNSKGYIMIPMRALVEAKGGIIMWFPGTREVTAWIEHDVLNVKIGKRTAHINSAVYLMPSAATIRRSRTIVPLEFLLKGMKLDAAYDRTKNRLSLSAK